MTNTVICGRAEKVIPSLQNLSIGLTLVSPPYAMQRADLYRSISEEEYPVWFASIMSSLRPKLRHDASVLVVIRSHVS